MTIVIVEQNSHYDCGGRYYRTDYCEHYGPCDRSGCCEHDGRFDRRN